MQVRRVIAGVSGSAGSLQALRFADAMARENDALLVPVLAWVPPGGDMADRRYPNATLRTAWKQAAWDRLWRAVDLAIGGPPVDARNFAPEVVRGEAGQVLTLTATKPGDVLVIGAGRQGGMRRMACRISRYCVGNAVCPVISVPPARLEAETHGLHRWILRHRLQPEDAGLRVSGAS